MLGLLQEGAQVGFSAAAGATGGVILSAGLGALACCCICAGGATYLCSQGVSGELSLVKVPAENIDQDGNIVHLDNLQRVNPQDVVKNAAPWSFSLSNFSKLVSDRLGRQVGNPEGDVKPVCPSDLEMANASLRMTA